MFYSPELTTVSLGRGSCHCRLRNSGLESSIGCCLWLDILLLTGLTEDCEWTNGSVADWRTQLGSNNLSNTMIEGIGSFVDSMVSFIKGLTRSIRIPWLYTNCLLEIVRLLYVKCVWMYVVRIRMYSIVHSIVILWVAAKHGRLSATPTLDITMSLETYTEKRR
jgi:hypothetical protein